MSIFVYLYLNYVSQGWSNPSNNEGQMEIFCPPTEHVTFLPSQLQPDTDVWLVLLLPEKGDIFEEVRESVHTPSHRWHWQFCSMCWVCCEQEMAVSCLHCFWCMNCYLFSFPGEILCIGRGRSVVHNIINTVRPEVFPKNTALQDCELSILCWELHWNWGSSLETEQSTPKQYKYHFSWGNQFSSNKVWHSNFVICYWCFNIGIFNS